VRGPARDILQALEASLHAKQRVAGPLARKGPRQAIREATHSKQERAASLVPRKISTLSHDKRAPVALRSL
jgi:hypothetical protein